MQSQTLRIRLEQKPILSQQMLITIGDTPLFSIHRINTLWKKNPPEISDELSRLFLRNLFIYNKKFQEKTKKKWNCITLDGFRFSIADTDKELQKMINEYSAGLELEPNELEQIKKSQVNKITVWFETNYENLIYSIGSELPWAFILYLKQRLIAWRGGFELAFDQSISEIQKKFNLNIG